jgi:hypothetical protein
MLMPRINSAAANTATKLIVLGAVVLSFAALEVRDTEAHGGLTSPSTYNYDVFPILRDRCGRCHVEGGPAPMSLVVYNDPPNGAVPWAQAIRDVLISEQMPPWYVDPTGPAAKGGHAIPPGDLDKLIMWAGGRTPLGDEAKKPERVVFKSDWSAGAPDLKIQMPMAHTVPEGTSEETVDVDITIPTGNAAARWVKMADLLPGNASIVRNAVISVAGGPVLAVWVPGDTAMATPKDSAFRLAPNAKLHLQIHYKKQWQQEGLKVSDRSTIGLYFATAPAKGGEIRSVAVDAPGGTTEKANAPQTFSGSFAAAGRVIAIRPSLDQTYSSVDIHAITPAGARVPLLVLRMPRPEWRRRYWLEQPVELPAGSKIEVSVVPPPDYVDLSGLHPKGYPLQISLDVTDK